MLGEFASTIIRGNTLVGSPLLAEAGEANSLLILALVAVLAFIAPFFSKALKLPIVVGEILFGVIVGTALHVMDLGGLEIDLTTDAIEVLSTLGFILLMFIIGMENDLEDLRSLTSREKWATALVILASFLISILPVVILDLPLMVGLILGGVSVTVVMPVLREMGLRRSVFGFKTMLIAQLADVTAIFLISISTASVSGWVALVEILMIPILFMLLFWFVDMLIWYRPRLMSRIFDPEDKSEIGIRATLAIILIFYGLALFIGIEAVLGAFLGGMLFSAIFKERGAMMDRFMPLGFGFLIPIFFIYQGFQVSFLELFHPYALSLLLLFSFIAILAKAIPLLISTYFKRKWSDVGGAVLLGTNLSVVVAGVKMGEEADLLSEGLASILILYGVLSCVLFPIIFRWIFKRYLEKFMTPVEEEGS